MKTDAERMEELAAAVRARHGIDPLASVAIRGRFELAVRELGADVDAIAGRLRVGETRFYRDGAQLDAVIASLSSRERVRVLSAGCSTGEEVYTLAMLLELANVQTFEVTGVDALVESVSSARSARYPSARVPPQMKRFFDERGEVVSAIATRCRFVVGDLLTTPLFGPFDAIFCRNVLIYLEDGVALGLVRRLASALTTDGILCVARSEVAIARRASLSARTLNGDVVVFGKTTTAAAASVSERFREAGDPSPPSRVRLIIRREDDPEDITKRGLSLLKTGSATVEVTIVGACDEPRLTALRRLAAAARARGGEHRPTDENTARVLRAL